MQVHSGIRRYEAAARGENKKTGGTKMKKRILALLMAGVLAVGLTACGGTSGETEETGGEAAETAGIAAADLTVGLILVGEAADA